jgi:hypothetical protein
VLVLVLGEAVLVIALAAVPFSGVKPPFPVAEAASRATD